MTDSAKRVEIDVHAEREVKPQENWPHIIEDEEDPLPRVEVKFFDAGTTQWWETGALCKPGDIRKYLVSAGPPEVVKKYKVKTGKLHIAADANKPPNTTYWEETTDAATWHDSVVFTRALSLLGTHEYTISEQPNSGEGCPEGEEGFDKEPRTNEFSYWGNTFGLDASALESEWTKATNARRFERKPIKPIGSADANNRRALNADQYNLRLKLKSGTSTIIVDVNKDLKDSKEDKGQFQIKNPSDAIKYTRNLPQSGKFHVAFEEKGSQTYGHYAEIVGSGLFHIESSPRSLKFGNDWIVPEGIFFPPFDTSDTTNFKVTRVPKFDCDEADEVTGEFLKLRGVMTNKVEIFLQPRHWAYWARQSSNKDWTDPGKWIYYNLTCDSCCSGIKDCLWGSTWSGCLRLDACGDPDPCWLVKDWECVSGPTGVTFGAGCDCVETWRTYPCPDPYQYNFEVWCGYRCQTAHYSGCTPSYDSPVFVPICLGQWAYGCGEEYETGGDSGCVMAWDPPGACGDADCTSCQSPNAASVWKAWLGAPHHVKSHHHIGIWWDRFPNHFAIGPYLPSTTADNAYFGCKSLDLSLATWYADPSKAQAKVQTLEAGGGAGEIENIISGFNALHVIGTVFNTMEFAVAYYGLPWYANRKSTPPLKVINEELYLGNLASNWMQIYNKIHYNPQWYFVEATPKYPGVTTAGGEGGPRIPIPGHPFSEWTDEEIEDWAGESVMFPNGLAPDEKDAYEVHDDFEARMGWGTKYDRPIGIGISPLKAEALVAVIRVNKNEEFYVWRRTAETFTVHKTGDVIADCLSYDDQTCYGEGYIEQVRGPAGGRKLTHYKVTPTLECMTTEQLYDEDGCYAGEKNIDDCFYWPVHCILIAGDGATALDREIHVMAAKDWAFTGETGRVARRSFAISLDATTRNLDSVTI